MTFVYFSHIADQKLIEQSVRSLRRIYNTPKITVFWENDKDGFLNGVKNLTSDFDRKGNLNGLECCKGIINSMISLDDDEFVKIDSDTILTKPLEKFGDFLFFEAVQAFLGVGCCYGISLNTLLKCSEKLNNYTEVPNFKYQEDLTISALCQNVAQGTLKLWNGGEHISGYKNDKNWEEYSKKTVVHFGNGDKKADPRFKKARDAAHMTFFNDWLDSR